MYMWTPGQMRPTFNKWSFPPEARVQMSKCLVNRKHCLSPSFLSERDPRRTLLSTPRSLLDGSWMREPGSGGVMKGRESAVHLKQSWLKAETDVVVLTLSDKGLTGVQQNVTAFNYHPLYGKVLPYILCVAHFIMHHPDGKSYGTLLLQWLHRHYYHRFMQIRWWTHILWQLLQFGFSKLQTLVFHVLMRCVCQQLMECDDVAGDLK